MCLSSRRTQLSQTKLHWATLQQEPRKYYRGTLHGARDLAVHECLSLVQDGMHPACSVLTCCHPHTCHWLQGVLDLQLLDLLVWESTATEQQCLQRLKGYLRRNIEAVPQLYRGVYQVGCTPIMGATPMTRHRLGMYCCHMKMSS